MEAQESEAEEVLEELETGKVDENVRVRSREKHPVERRWRGENVLWVQRCRDGSAEAEKERRDGVSEERGVDIPEGWYDEACGFKQDLTWLHGVLVTRGGEGSGAGG